ncbi:MAG: hypothetical protein SFZ23_13630 [Planctomycetota bacterium]|nr:hypothetical protein [Planctomycetota bacterium]
MGGGAVQLEDRALARCVVLGGGLKPSPLQAMCPSSVLDLDLCPGSSVLYEIARRTAEIAQGWSSPLRVMVVHGEPYPAPAGLASPPANVALTVVAEPKRWRGPAGVVLDLCEDAPADSSILVLEGARWYASSLRALVADHAARGADVTIAQSPDRSPAGAYVIRRSALSAVPKLGFLDLKEQFLTKLQREKKRLFVHALAQPGTLPLRTLPEFLHTARAANDAHSDWRVVDPTASVHPSATLLSCVVMRGARVGEGALVARSLVLEGGVVEAGAEIVDAVVHARGITHAPGSFFSGRFMYGSSLRTSSLGSGSVSGLAQASGVESRSAEPLDSGRADRGRGQRDATQGGGS